MSVFPSSAQISARLVRTWKSVAPKDRVSTSSAAMESIAERKRYVASPLAVRATANTQVAPVAAEDVWQASASLQGAISGLVSTTRIALAVGVFWRGTVDTAL